MIQLFQATHIWLDSATKQEATAPVCLRWQDVRSIEQDVDSGPEKWQYKGPVTFLITTTKSYHILGSYDKWLAMWQRYTASALASFLSAN